MGGSSVSSREYCERECSCLELMMSKQISLDRFVGSGSSASKRRKTQTLEDQPSDRPDSPVSVPRHETESETNRSTRANSDSDSDDETGSPSMRECDIALSTEFPPIQPTGIQFPKTTFSGKARSFNAAWYQTYPWLEYSIARDAAFCYPCRLFGLNISTSGSRPEQAFTVNGFRDWKHATGPKRGILVNHDKCLSHKEALVAWDHFKSTSHSGSVADQLGSARAIQIKNNKHYLKAVCEVLLLCSRQEIALRGHRESNQSANRGNFLEILSLVSAHDSVVSERLSCGPRNAMYTAPAIQNSILKIMADIVRNTVCNSVKKSGFYSILADETKDLSKKEQLSIVVRYVDVDSMDIVERFLTYTVASSLNAESLCQYILDALKKYCLDINMLVSQGYDGASVMSGASNGVQARIRAIVPQAVYVHCHAHILNLVLVDCMKSNADAFEFFSLVQCLYVFISTSKAHAIFLEKQAELHPKKQPRQLQRLSDTRWACRYLALDAIAHTFDSL